MFSRKLRALSLCLLVLLLAGFATSALAEGKLHPIMPLYGGMKSYYQLDVEGMPYNAKLISAKSSNPKIIAIKTGVKEKNDIVVRALKAGTVTITIKYKVGKKTYTVKDKLTAKKFPRIFKSLKVAGKTVDLKKDVGGYTLKKFKKTTAKIEIVPANGWEIGNIRGYIGGKSVSITNGKNFSIPKKKDAYINVSAYNDEGEYLYYVIEIKR